LPTKSIFESFVNPNNIQINISSVIPSFSLPIVPPFGFNQSLSQSFNTSFNQSFNQSFGQLQMNQLISSQNNLMKIPNNLFNTSENFLYIVYEF
jgi:hypothetical protein